jgi:GNAT superfamily N-acetyltransferase
MRYNMALIQRTALLHAIRRVLAATHACHEDDFMREGTNVVVAEVRDGRMKYPMPERSLSIVTLGKGVSISCTTGRIEWAKKSLGGLTREQLFSASTIARVQRHIEQDGQWLAGPIQRYVCSKEDLRAFIIPEEISVTLVERGDIPALYAHDQFRNALSYHIESMRPDVLASVAERHGAVIGIAGASADCDVMWQIGVDVLSEYQGRGIGKALVGTLSQALWKRDIIPYYSTKVSNLQSRQVASSLGYWPAWVDLYAKDS